MGDDPIWYGHLPFKHFVNYCKKNLVYEMHDFLIAATASRDTAVQTARVGLAIGSSVFLVKTGMDYLNAIDSQVASRK